MWIESPQTGDMINFDEVYKIRTYQSVSSKAKELTIEIYFFSKDFQAGDDYYQTKERTETFFNGDQLTGEQVREWLQERLGVLKFQAIDTPPVEIVIEEVTKKRLVEKCRKRVSDIKLLLPEDVYLNPFLNSILQDQKVVDYIIERANSMSFADTYKSWELDYDVTVEINNALGILENTMKTLGFAPKLTKYQKETLQSIIGEGEKTDE